MSVKKSKSHKIFLSIGHNLTGSQENVAKLIKNQLMQLDIQPLVIERKAQMISDPIEMIRNIIKKTNGTIVVAFDRFHIVEGVEFPKSDTPKPFSNRNLTTVWNQLEGAMTLQALHPLLILCENNLHFEGIIDPTIHPVLTFDSQLITSQLPEDLSDALVEWSNWL